MTEVPRRTVSELLFLHQMERSLKDIFVEGDYDVAIVLQFLRGIGYEDVVVRSIDCIEIDDVGLRLDGRDVGNRERVIYLAEQVSNHLEIEGQILCIADRDYSNWIGPIPEFRDLVLTDYSCMDMYVWNSKVLRKFLTVYCNRPLWSVEQFCEALQTPLQCLFAIRLSVRLLGLKLKWFDRLRCMNVDGWSIVLDVQEFLKRLLNKNSLFNELDCLLVCVDRFRSQFSGDPRQSIHSQDFSHLVTYLLNRKRVTAVATDERTITRAMATCLEVADLQSECLFQRVEEFAPVSA